MCRGDYLRHLANVHISSTKSREISLFYRPETSHHVQRPIWSHCIFLAPGGLSGERRHLSSLKRMVRFREARQLTQGPPALTSSDLCRTHPWPVVSPGPGLFLLQLPLRRRGRGRGLSVQDQLCPPDIGQGSLRSLPPHSVHRQPLPHNRPTGHFALGREKPHPSPAPGHCFPECVMGSNASPR